MADIQAGNYVEGRSNERRIEGYVLRLVSLHEPGNAPNLRGAAYILNTVNPNKVTISAATDLQPSSPDLSRIRDLAKLGFIKTDKGWEHPQHPFPEASLVKFLPRATASGLELPNMNEVLDGIRRISLMPKAAL